METTTVRKLGWGLIVLGALAFLTIVGIIPGFLLMIIGGVLLAESNRRRLAVEAAAHQI